MWKRDDGGKTAPGPGMAPAHGNAAGTAEPASPPSRPTPDFKRQLGSDVVNIGKSVVIKGELNGSEDLTIEGQVDGKIELRQNVLTIGPNGKIKAQVFAKSVIVLGEVVGNITATEKVDIRDNGSVDGDITSPRVAIAEGSHFRGSIDMQRTAASAAAASAGATPRLHPGEPRPDVKTETKTVAAAAAVGARH
jgi:cytoskeletal protein CcmA (bactofilin family)